MIWDYLTHEYRNKLPDGGFHLPARHDSSYPLRCRQDGRTFTVLIDGDDPFRPGIPEVQQAIVLQTIRRCPGLKFLITTRHIHTAKFLLRKRSKEDVDYAQKWLRHKDHGKRDCEGAKAAVRRAQEPFLPNLRIVYEHSFLASQCALRLGGGEPGVYKEPE